MTSQTSNVGFSVAEFKKWSKFGLTDADDEPPVPLTPEEHAAIAASKAAAARREFATDERPGRCGLNRVCEA